MVIDTSDKRVIAAAVTAVIVIGGLLIFLIAFPRTGVPVTVQQPISQPRVSAPNLPSNDAGNRTTFEKAANQPAGELLGYRLDSINEPAKSAQCQPPRELYRTDDCVKQSDGRVICKLGCR